MSGYLLDTNVLSELTRDIPDPRVVTLIAQANDLAVATRNVADFQHLNVAVVNPWDTP